MLKKFLAVTAMFIMLTAASQINASNISLQTKQKTVPASSAEQLQVSDKIYKQVKALDLVAQPAKFMSKKIKITAKFDKFSTLGLDYAPANRDTKNHISFLIKREDVKGYNIPLSELKLILKRDYAEKELVNIETGDDIEIYGTVFCMALGDPWVDVDKVVILTPKENRDKKELSEGK